jgi:RNA recognition motif-containing protein
MSNNVNPNADVNEGMLKEGVTRRCPYPPGCRLFLGNLASEKTSRKELLEIFGEYGQVEEVVVRRSFGFVQYATPEEAQDAIKAENGRMIGGLNLG